MRKFFVLFLLLFSSLISKSENVSPTYLASQIVTKIVLHDASFFLSDSPDLLVVSETNLVLLPDGSEVVIRCRALDSSSNIWLWGEGLKIEKKNGCEIIDAPMNGWLDAADELSIYSNMTSAINSLQEDMRRCEKEKYEREEMEREKWEKEHYNKGVTYLAFISIEIGMSYFEAERIVGIDSKEISRSGNIVEYEIKDRGKAIYLKTDGFYIIEKKQSGL